MALHCTECGFVNSEGANYCQRCGAPLAREDAGGDVVTATYRIDDETGEPFRSTQSRSPRAVPRS